MINYVCHAWADPEIFKRRGQTSKSKKKRQKGVYDVCLGARCFLYTYVWYNFFFTRQWRFGTWGGGGGGAWFLYKEILGDQCPFGKL